VAEDEDVIARGVEGAPCLVGDGAVGEDMTGFELEGANDGEALAMDEVRVEVSGVGVVVEYCTKERGSRLAAVLVG
jgi:hypothetical protein